ncbi:hypothetical protein, partial [Rhodococcus sp. NPDC058514]
MSNDNTSERNGVQGSIFAPVRDDVMFEDDSPHRVSLTQEDTAALLTRNTRNRSLRADVVEKYRRQFESGSWPYTGDSIRFDRNGVMIDGQHRAHAHLSAPKGTTWETAIVWNLDPTVMRYIDVNSGRSAADALQIEGIPEARQVSSVVRYHLIMREYGDRYPVTLLGSKSAAVAPDPVVTAWAMDPAHRVEVEQIAADYRKYKAVGKLDISAPVWGVVRFYTRAIDRELSDRMFSGLAHGLNLDADDPIHVAREAFTTRAHSVRSNGADRWSRAEQ